MYNTCKISSEYRCAPLGSTLPDSVLVCCWFVMLLWGRFDRLRLALNKSRWGTTAMLLRLELSSSDRSYACCLQHWGLFEGGRVFIVICMINLGTVFRGFTVTIVRCNYTTTTALRWRKSLKKLLDCFLICCCKGHRIVLERWFI